MTSPLPDLLGLTILVVDDNEDALYVLETLLKACGATVLAARNAFTALGYLETSRVDLILSDLSMAQMDGIELIERIRKSPEHKTTPAIAISAFPESFRNAVPAGFNLFMRKPIDLDTLCGAIFELLRGGNTGQNTRSCRDQLEAMIDRQVQVELAFGWDAAARGRDQRGVEFLRRRERQDVVQVLADDAGRPKLREACPLDDVKKQIVEQAVETDNVRAVCRPYGISRSHTDRAWGRGRGIPSGAGRRWHARLVADKSRRQIDHP